MKRAHKMHWKKRISLKRAVLCAAGGLFALTAAQSTHAFDGDAALCLERAKKGDISVCERIAAQNPEDIEAKRALALGYVEIGDFSSVVDVYQEIADRIPGDVRALYDLSGALGFIRRYDEAAEILNRLVELEPGNAEIRMALAIMYSALDRPEDLFRATLAAAELGDAVAMYDLHIYLRDGVGTAPDAKSSLAWAEKAAEAGHANAMKKLIDVYLTGAPGIEPNGEDAEKWARRLHALEAGE